jgi:hypothetical protein
LQPAIEELEAVGFLEALPAAQRFVKISRGEWRIIFIRKTVPQFEPASHNAALLIKRLAARGVTPSVATELVRDYPHELIEMQMEVLDRLQQAKERESIRNPAGYLVKSIREGFVPPANLFPKRTLPKNSPLPKPEVLAQPDPVQEQINAYLLSLEKHELDELERSALEHVEPTLLEGYQRSQRTGGAAFSVYRRMVQEREAKRRLFTPSEPAKTAA